MIHRRSGSISVSPARNNGCMRGRQLPLFSAAEMCDRTRSRNYSPIGEEFRRVHARRRTWGKAKGHAERLRRLHDAQLAPITQHPLRPWTATEKRWPPCRRPAAPTGGAARPGPPPSPPRDHPIATAQRAQPSPPAPSRSPSLSRSVPQSGELPSRPTVPPSSRAEDQPGKQNPAGQPGRAGQPHQNGKPARKRQSSPALDEQVRSDVHHEPAARPTPVEQPAATDRGEPHGRIDTPPLLPGLMQELPAPATGGCRSVPSLRPSGTTLHPRAGRQAAQIAKNGRRHTRGPGTGSGSDCNRPVLHTNTIPTESPRIRRRFLTFGEHDRRGRGRSPPNKPAPYRCVASHAFSGSHSVQAR
jgi:hypothetical protein